MYDNITTLLKKKGLEFFFFYKNSFNSMCVCVYIFEWVVVDDDD